MPARSGLRLRGPQAERRLPEEPVLPCGVRPLGSRAVLGRSRSPPARPRPCPPAAAPARCANLLREIMRNPFLSQGCARRAAPPARAASRLLAISSPSGEGDVPLRQATGRPTPDAVRSAPVEHAPVQLVDRVGQARVRLVVRHHDDRAASRPAAKSANVAEHASPTRRSSRSFVGSSARMTSWPASRARATTSRRFCPTDSSHGRWSARSARPNRSKAASTAFLVGAGARRLAREHQVLARGQGLEQIGALEDEADALAVQRVEARRPWRGTRPRP